MFERMKAICANEATITPGFNEPSMETIAICGLLHDICKANFYAVEMRNRKNDQGRWSSTRSMWSMTSCLTGTVRRASTSFLPVHTPEP